MNRVISAASVVVIAAVLVAIALDHNGDALAQDAAKPKGEAISYKVGEDEFLGYVATPGGDKKYPAVLIVHDWLGEKQFERDKADLLASMGYVAFAADMYGKGVRPKDATEARNETMKFYKEPEKLRARVLGAFNLLKDRKDVDAAKIVAMGFCFGGTCVLELARGGASVAAVVPFHGGLKTDKRAAADTLKAKVLVLHGADDPYIPQEDIDALHKEMRDAKADWQMVYFGNSVHSFSQPHAGNDNSKGAAYNEKADKRSWEMFKDFLAEVTK
jgi:dienelactone hydrolase